MLKNKLRQTVAFAKDLAVIITLSAKNTEDRSKYLPHLLFLFFTTQRMSKTKTNNKCQPTAGKKHLKIHYYANNDVINITLCAT